MEKEFLEIKRLLDSHKIKYEVFEHEPVFTSEQAAAVRKEPLHSGVKSLVFKGDDSFFLVLVPGDKKADMQKLRTITGKKNIRLAEPEEVKTITNCEIGSVHPFGTLHGLDIYMEKSILLNKKVNFNVGLHTITVRMDPMELRDIIKPTVVDLVK